MKKKSLIIGFICTILFITIILVKQGMVLPAIFLSLLNKSSNIFTK